MMGQNSFSNNDTNSNSTVFSNSGQPAGYPAPTPITTPPNPQNAQTNDIPSNQQPAKKFTPTILIVAVISALIGAGVAVGIILLTNRQPEAPEEETIELIENVSPENDGTQPIQETISEFDQRIENAKTDQESFTLKIDKVSYYILNDEYDAAIAALDAFDINLLDDSQKYHVYNSYTTAYTGKGDAAQAERFRQLAEDVQDRTYYTTEQDEGEE